MNAPNETIDVAKPASPAPDTSAPHDRRAMQSVLAVLGTFATTIVAAAIRLPIAIKPPNVNMIGSLGLFGGARLPLWQAIGMPLAAMVASDLMLEQLFGWRAFIPYVYIGFAAYILLGRFLLRRNDAPLRIGAVSLLGSAVFFVITNFGAWITDINSTNPWYESTLAGLVKCFTAGIPFFGYTLAGDLGFAAVLFGAHVYAKATLSARANAASEEAAG